MCAHNQNQPGEQVPQLFIRYLLSNRSLAALGAAVAVTALYLFGFLDRWWWAIAAAAYAAVWTLPLDTKKKAEPVPADVSTQESLTWLQTTAMKDLPASARALLGDILERIQDVLPRLKELEGAGLIQAENRAALKQTVKVFLPNAVGTYLRLPASYARTAKVSDGLTAEDLLVTQLRTLQTHVRGIQENLLSSDVDELVAQSRFLNEKFARPIELVSRD